MDRINNLSIFTYIFHEYGDTLFVLEDSALVNFTHLLLQFSLFLLIRRLLISFLLLFVEFVKVEHTYLIKV